MDFFLLFLVSLSFSSITCQEYINGLKVDGNIEWHSKVPSIMQNERYKELIITAMPYIALLTTLLIAICILYIYYRKMTKSSNRELIFSYFPLNFLIKWFDKKIELFLWTESLVFVDTEQPKQSNSVPSMSIKSATTTL